MEDKKNFFENIKEYFATTPREQIIAEWEATAEYDKVNSPTMEEFLNVHKMKQTYKLINLDTKVETICEKVVVDGGFEYYITEYPKKIDGQFCIDINGKFFKDEPHFPISIRQRMVFATTDPTIDVPQIVDEVEVLAEKANRYSLYGKNGEKAIAFHEGFIGGYNKRAETHKWTDKDMVEFQIWSNSSQEADKFWRNNRMSPQMDGSDNLFYKNKTRQLLQLFKDQQPKVLYYK